MRFSIVTPVCVYHQHRYNQLIRCIGSVENQTFKDWEMVVVDDGSPIELPPGTNQVKILHQPRLERINAYNQALENVAGEWICFLDSDDEYLSYTLQAFDQAIKKYPDFKMFNFASLHVSRNYSLRVRDVFAPPMRSFGHDLFGRGNIVNGTFIFHRSILEEIGGFPQNNTFKNPHAPERYLTMSSPWDFATAATLEMPEIRQFCEVSNEEIGQKVIQELGNPWGNDYYLFFKYTRKYHSKPINVPLVLIHHEGKADGEAHDID